MTDIRYKVNVRAQILNLTYAITILINFLNRSKVFLNPYLTLHVKM